MGYSAVLRVQPRRVGEFKNKMQGHQLRENPDNNIDAKRTKLNELVYGSKDIEGGLNALLEKYGKVTHRSVDAAEIILTANQEFFDEISPNWREGKYSKQFLEWKKLCLDWAKENYGEGLSSMVLHMDEAAPHFHVNIVPIHTYEKKYRRGSKTVTKSNYSHYFNDPKALLKQAKIEGNSELTKLGRLQTSIAQALAPVGLERGVAGSDRRHTTTRQWEREQRKELNKPERHEPEPVPDNTIFTALCDAVGITTERDKILAMNEAGKRQFLKEIRKYRKTTEEKAKAHDRMKKDRNTMEKANKLKDEQIKVMRDDLQITKSQIDALRKTDLQLVADRLQYDGYFKDRNGKPYKGAIDMVMEVSSLSYEDAVVWMYQECGSEASQTALTEHAINQAEVKAEEINQQHLRGKLERAATPQEKAIAHNLGKQLDALNADTYRITCMHNDKPTFNVGKGKGIAGEERFYTAAEVLKQIPKLNYDNGARGYNIFITPIDEMAHYVLLDDLTAEKLAEVKALGITPCIEQYSSEGNIQAVVRIAGGDDLQPAANEWFKYMNKKYGDQNIQALRHPFRAAGFRNVKPKHIQKDGKYPIVKVIHAASQSCITALTQITAIAKDMLVNRPKTAKGAAKELLKYIKAKDKNVDILPDLERLAVQKYSILAKQYSTELNLSQADWMLSKDLLGRGYEAREIAAVILKHSPNIENRHKDFVTYINRTLTNASNTVVAKENKNTYKP